MYSTESDKPMRNLPAVFIIIFCLMCLPAQAQTIQQDKAKASKAKMFRDCPGCPEMVVIQAGNFAMGSPDTEAGRGKNEGPLHPVKIATFALSKTEITRGQFAAFVKKKQNTTRVINVGPMKAENLQSATVTGANPAMNKMTNILLPV